jgi:pimeloyl-ACP methyl ester carboxylesterase
MRRNMILPASLAILLCTATIADAQNRDVMVLERGKAFVSKLAAGEFKNAVTGFDSTMGAQMSADQLSELWGAIQGQVGAYKAITTARTEKIDKYTIVYVTTEFMKGPLDVKVVFDDQNRIAGLYIAPVSGPDAWKQPDYVRGEAFRQQDVTFGLPGWELPGKLYVPVGDARFPAVVLVHGSGPNDRDETIGPNKPFKDIAFGLATRGVVVLAYDKRTKVHSEKFIAIPNYTVNDETVDDAVAAVEFLATQACVDTNRIYVLGHSLGAMMAPRIAERSGKVAGLILLAAPARPFEDVYLDQIRYLDSLDIASGAKSQFDLPLTQKQVELVKSDQLSVNTPAAELPMGIGPAYWLDLRSYQPDQVAASLNIPILLLQGGRDYQVTDEDYQMWKTTLDKIPIATTTNYPNLNHLFMPGEGMATPTEYLNADHVVGPVIKDVYEWILHH